MVVLQANSVVPFFARIPPEIGTVPSDVSRSEVRSVLISVISLPAISFATAEPLDEATLMPASLSSRLPLVIAVLPGYEATPPYGSAVTPEPALCFTLSSPVLTSVAELRLIESSIASNLQLLKNDIFDTGSSNTLCSRTVLKKITWSERFHVRVQVPDCLEESIFVVAV